MLELKIRLHLKIFVFIAIFILTRQIKIYGILMLFALLHELGHMLAGICLGFKPYSLEIMPVGLSISFKSKAENYNKKIRNGTLLTMKKMFIAMAGPLTNLLFVLIFSIFDISFFKEERELIIYANFLIAIFNLIPIYPLDGGRIIKEILHIFCGRKNSYIFTNKISYACIILLTAMSSIAIFYLRNASILVILLYLWYLVISEDRKFNNKIQLYNRLNKLKGYSSNSIDDRMHYIRISK